MSSTTTQIAPTPPDEQRFVFHDLSWERYEQLLRSLGDRRLRHTYVEGALEIVSPSMHHEWLKSVLGDLVAASCRLLGLPRKSSKSRLFPFLSAADITRLLAKRDTMDDTQIELEFAAWAATQIARDAKGHRK